MFIVLWDVWIVINITRSLSDKNALIDLAIPSVAIMTLPYR